MSLSRFLIYPLLVLMGFACSSTKQATQQQPTAGSAVSSNQSAINLIDKLPATDQKEGQWVFSELVATGPAGIQSLTDMLVPPGSGNDTQARFAINGLTKYVSRDGMESEQSMFEEMLLKGLRSNYQPSVKGFLMEQLELVGCNQSVPVLKTFLGDENLHKPAVHALQSINNKQARQALERALSETQGEERTAVIKALGDMKDKSVASELMPFASSDDWQIKKAALYALAQTGDPAATEPLSAAIDEQQSYRRTTTQSYYVLLAKRLAEESNHEKSVQLSRNMLSGEYPSHIKSAALRLLFENEGEAVLDKLLDAAVSKDQRQRFAALSILEEHGELEIPKQWINQFDEYAPEVQADIIAKLGPGRASVSMLMPYIESDHQAVRAAAAQAVASIGGEEALSGLLDALLGTQKSEDIAALKAALLQLPTKALVSNAEEALPSAGSRAKIALIKMLEARRATSYSDLVINQLDSSDPQLRLAVYQSLGKLGNAEELGQITTLLTDTKTEDERKTLLQSMVTIAEESASAAAILLDSMNDLPATQKASVIGILPAIGGEKALDAVVEARNSRSISVKGEAGKALANWPESSAISPLFAAFKSASGAERKKLLQGYIRLVGQSNYAAEDKVRFLQDAYDVSTTGTEQSILLKGFADLGSPDALQAVAGHFEDKQPEIRQQSLRSAARILAQSGGETRQQLSLLEATTSAQTRDKIEQYLQEFQTDTKQTDNFTSLFNGKDLSGWTGNTDSYRVEDGQIISKEGAAGNLFTEQEYSNFILKFEFKLTPGANNGIGIRAPLEGNPAYDGMELQILDNTAEKYADLQPYQFHGSVYGVAPAERGYLNAVGEWNTQEVIADGSEITVIVNGETILKTDLQEAGKPETMDGKDHPGLFRESGHIGFLGHGDEVAFRNIRIRDLDVYYPDYSMSSENKEGINQPPEGFTALFNGENLEGWKGLVGNPESRAKMSEQELARKQAQADSVMRKHWFVRDGILHYDGKGESLVTDKDYGDFEMMVDWKIEPGGDSGIYLRGTPQVQIWDPTEWPQGSGGLYNNQKHPSQPLAAADNAIGEWNSMRIKMTGEKVTVHLNDQLVVDDVVMENYWDRDKPIYPSGQLELQQHNAPLYFKNIFIREIPRQQNLFNGQDLTGWKRVGGDAGGWHADNGLLYTKGGGEKWEKGAGGGWLSTTETYDDFKLQLEYRLPEGGNSGVFLRAPHKGDPAYEGLEIQLLDDYAEEYAALEPWQYTGSIYDVKAPSRRVSKQAGQWQKMEITLKESQIRVRLNDELIINTNLVNYMNRVNEHPGLKRRSGYIGLQNHNSRVEFRNITIKEIK